MKYAPPPDLTSNNASPYTNPTFQTFLPTQNVSAPPTILNPYESEGLAQSNNSSVQQISFLSEQLPISEQLSRNSSLHNSFRSSPVATGTSYNPSVTPTNQNSFFESSSVSAPIASSSRPIPARVLEPATPQNTPANVSFPGFASYANRDLLPTSNFDKEIVLKNSNQLNSPSEFLKGNILETTTEFVYKPTLISGETEATFTPISAAKVTEKLEHLLAEQQENSSSITTPKVSSEVDEITSSVATELTKSFESQSDVLKATNEIIDKSHEAKLNDVQGKAAQPGSDTWSDVFLGQEPTAQSAICPEIHTTDNNPIITDLQTAKSHPPQQHYQVQSISMPSSTFYIDKPAEQKSSLNYVSPVQLPQQNDFYSLPKPTEQSASVFFESTKPNLFPSFSSQERNTNSPFRQSLVSATNNLPPAPENSAFSSKAIDSAHVPFWNADQSSQSQVLNAASSQQAYTTPSQPIHTTPIQQSAPVFYNPAQFANEQPKQSTFPHTYDQRSPQQQLYQTPSFYESSSGLQQPYAIPENNIANNTAYPSPAVSMAASVPEPTGSATLSPVQMSINSPTNRITPDTVPPSFQNLVRIFCAFDFSIYL